MFGEANLQRYRREHIALARLPAMMGRLMLSLGKASLRQRVMRAFVSAPPISDLTVKSSVAETGL